MDPMEARGRELILDRVLAKAESYELPMSNDPMLLAR
jgi:type III secretion system FlhB-like substrate exporter